MLSIEKKFLFIHIPKTGGNSIQNLLIKYSEDTIKINQNYQDGIERFEVERKGFNFHKHSTLGDYKSVLNRKTYKSLYKFAVIRNPWDRLISFYFSPHRNVNKWNRKDFIKLINEVSPINEFLKTECVFRTYFRKSFSEIDFMLRFENLNEDFRILCHELNVPFVPLPHRNKSNRRHYSYYYDEELIHLVKKRFESDIKLGNYQFNN